MLQCTYCSYNVFYVYYGRLCCLNVFTFEFQYRLFWIFLILMALDMATLDDLCKFIIRSTYIMHSFCLSTRGWHYSLVKWLSTSLVSFFIIDLSLDISIVLYLICTVQYMCMNFRTGTICSPLINCFENALLLWSWTILGQRLPLSLKTSLLILLRTTATSISPQVLCTLSKQ